MNKFKQEKAILNNAIKVLSQKNYVIKNIEFPRNETNFIIMFFLDEMSSPDAFPKNSEPFMIPPENLIGFSMSCCNCPDCYEQGVRQIAHDILKWADSLPECDEVPDFICNGLKIS